MLPASGKFKFCFLELSGFFFSPNIFKPQLVDFSDAESMDTKEQLYMALWQKLPCALDKTIPMNLQYMDLSKCHG